MTEEEIKNLKIGDKFTMEYVVSEEDRADVDLPIRAESNDGTLLWVSSLNLKHATLVKPTPTFEVGDTVRIVPDPMTGTAYSDCIVLTRHIGKTGIVKVECDNHGQMQVDMGDAEENGYTIIDIHCLELVKKAVKDKFDVRRYLDFDGLDDGWGVCDKKTLDTIVYFACSYPNAEAAAREACDRLNKDWRDKQNN